VALCQKHGELLSAGLTQESQVFRENESDDEGDAFASLTFEEDTVPTNPSLCDVYQTFMPILLEGVAIG
jgi:hypothetical protein